LTFFVLIPVGVILGSAFGFGIGMRQTNEMKVAKEGPAQQCERRGI
jgi:hypothetical protein